MIDWLNPSDDVLDARSIGFAEGQQSRDEEVAALTTERDALAAELDRLSRIEAALPKTADGVTIVPGMEVWANIGDIEPWHCGVVSIHVSEEYDLTVRDGDGEEDEANTDDCYSSREAAKKARKA